MIPLLLNKYYVDWLCHHSNCWKPKTTKGNRWGAGGKFSKNKFEFLLPHKNALKPCNNAACGSRFPHPLNMCYHYLRFLAWRVIQSAAAATQMFHLQFQINFEEFLLSTMSSSSSSAELLIRGVLIICSRSCLGGNSDSCGLKDMIPFLLHLIIWNQFL